MTHTEDQTPLETRVDELRAALEEYAAGVNLPDAPADVPVPDSPAGVPVPDSAADVPVPDAPADVHVPDSPADIAPDEKPADDYTVTAARPEATDAEASGDEEPTEAAPQPARSEAESSRKSGRGRPSAVDAERARQQHPDAERARQQNPDAEGDKRRPTPRRGPADPVRTLMHRHKALCARAVDPLEIAAGLEAQGVTDRTAATFRHRDVFGLAEELFARTHREPPHPQPTPSAPPLDLPRTAAPAAAALAAAAAAARTDGGAQAALILAGAIAVAVALRFALDRGPLRARPKAHAALATTGLMAYVLYGDWMLAELIAGATAAGDFTAPEPKTAAAVALTAALPAAAATARWFGAQAATALRTSRDLDEFAARVRPLLTAATAMTGAAILALQLAAQWFTGGDLGTAVAATALGLALFEARLLAVHGHGRTAATVLTWTAAVHAAVLLLAVSARLPGLDAVGRPVELLVGAQGLTAVPAVLGTLAAAALLALAARSLTRASAHRSTARRKEQKDMPATHPHDKRSATPLQGGSR